MEEQFQKNLERWSQFCPEGAQIVGTKAANLEELKKRPLSASKTASWLSLLEDRQLKLLYIYGVADFSEGPVHDWISDPSNSVVILEDNPTKLASFFLRPEAEQLLVLENVWIYYLDPLNHCLEEIAKLFAPTNLVYKIVSLQNEEALDFFQYLKSKITFLHHLYASQTAEFADFGLRFLANYFCNLFTWPTSSMGDLLFSKFKDIPAVICGAGPSLEKNIDTLKTLKNRALIFAGGSAINALGAFQITPHLDVGIDPHQDQVMRTIMFDSFETPFLYRNRMNPEALQFVHGDKLHITGSSGFTISEYFEKACNIHRQEVEEGCNVLNFCLALATAMGCNPIILVGVDLAYSKGQSYSTGLKTHPIHGCHYLFSKNPQEELIVQKDIHGQPVLTLEKWIAESLWFSRFATRHSQTKILNATEGGIGIPDVANMTLNEVTQKFLTEEYDIECRLFGETQCAKTPSQVTQEKLLELLEKMEMGLQKSHSCLKWQQEELMRLKEINMDSPPLTPKDTKSEFYRQRQEKLIDEPGYRYLLRSFDAAFDLIYRRLLTRLSIDRNLLSLQDWQGRLLEIEFQRSLYLDTAAQVLGSLIQQIATFEKARVEELQKSPQQAATYEPSFSECLYTYENGTLHIVDYDCHLNVEERFTADPDQVFQLFYPNGHLKLISYKKNNQLHGPTRFLYENGSLAAEDWFLNGLQEGKAFRCYPSGSQHSLQQYRQGKKYGLQKYFYENGCLKSVLYYNADGLLDGDICLYHSNGVLARKIQFSKGQRHGKEFCWTPKGKLFVEAEYQDGLANGTARLWHPNGQLAYEISYQQPGKLTHFTQWDDAGKVIQSEIPADYFQNLAKHTQQLTTSLKVLFDQMNILAPILAELDSKDPMIQQASEKMQLMHQNLSVLKQGIDHLQTLNDQMSKASNAETEAQKEAIWKTTALEREIQTKLNESTKLMQGELEELKTLLTKAIKAMKSKLSEQDEEK